MECNEVKYDRLMGKVKLTGTVQFNAKKVVLGSEFICLDFDASPMIISFEKVNRLVFNINGKKFTYIKEVKK